MKKIHIAALVAILLFGVLVFVAHQPRERKENKEPVHLAIAFEGNLESPSADLHPFLQNQIRPERLPESTWLRWGHQMGAGQERQAVVWLEADFVSRADSLAFCAQVLRSQEVSWQPAGALETGQFAANMEFAWPTPEGGTLRWTGVRCYGELYRI